MPLGNKFATLNHMSYVLISYTGDLEASMTKYMKAKYKKERKDQKLNVQKIKFEV